MRAELGPKAQIDPEFLERERMVLVSDGSDRATVLPPTPRSLARIGRGLRVRQLPGPQNALGREGARQPRPTAGTPRDRPSSRVAADRGRIGHAS